jgi:hypothetical protein
MKDAMVNSDNKLGQPKNDIHPDYFHEVWQAVCPDYGDKPKPSKTIMI